MPDAKPYHCGKAMCCIPHIHYETLKKKIYRLIKIGVIEAVDGVDATMVCTSVL
jgi:hypothetical protein